MADGFQAVYKRHTPFALAEYDYTLQGGTRVVLDKNGDVLLYAYLYKDGVNYVDWSSIDGIDLCIGGQAVCSWDSKFITQFLPSFSGTFSKTAYNDTFTFLPIPVPMIPTKNLRYHQCELIIHWRNGVAQDIRCMIVYAFVDEDIPECDVLIHQMKKLQVRENEPTRIHGMVKYMVSDTLSQPSTLNDAIVAPLNVYKYFHTYIGDANYRNFTFADVNLGTPRTCQRVGTNIYIFPSDAPLVYVFDTRSYFGNQQNYTAIPGKPYTRSSCTDGTDVYGGTIDGTVFRVSDGSTVFTVPFQIWALYYYNGDIYAVGTNNISKNGTTILSTSDDTYTSSIITDDGRVYMFGKGGKNIICNLNNNIVYEFTPSVDQSFDQYSASITVNGVSYIASGYNNIFRAGQEEFKLGSKEQPYITLVYDGNRFVYVYGFETVFRYEIYKYTLFVPFCLESHSPGPSGHANFNMMGDVIFRGCGTGTLYTVNYNILRIQNGMAGILYAH